MVGLARPRDYYVIVHSYFLSRDKESAHAETSPIAASRILRVPSNKIVILWFVFVLFRWSSVRE
jgi:hypothetical protein